MDAKITNSNENKANPVNYSTQGFTGDPGKVTRFSGDREYIPIGSESRGCFTVSRDCVTKVMEIYRRASKHRPVMIFAKYK